MGFLIFGVFFVVVFIIAPFLIAKLIWDILGIRKPGIKLVIFCVCAVVMWQQWQLPKDPPIIAHQATAKTATAR